MTARRASAWMRTRLNDETGFTLTELLVGTMVGGIVISAAITLVLMSMNASTRVSDKVAGLSSGRLALEQIEQRLHSATCLTSTEYSVNSTTPVGAANSIVFAGPTEVVYFADVSNGNGATNVADSVGFLPYLRYLIVDQGATNQVAGRQTRIVDGYRVPTTSAIPFNYSMSPKTSPTDFTAFALKDNIAAPNGATPSTTRQLIQLVTNGVSGSTSLPFLQYFDGPTSELAVSATTGAVPYSLLDEIDHIRVNFKVLAESGEDSANTVTGGATALDNRTVQFSDDIYLRVSSGECTNF